MRAAKGHERGGGRSDRLRCRTQIADVLMEMENVTAKVDAATGGLSDTAANDARKKTLTQLEQACEQAGRTVYRVRVGPFDRKEDADSAKEKLSEAGVDSALVRVQK